MHKLRRRLIAAAAAVGVVSALISAPTMAMAAGPNLAAGKTFTASTFTDVYPAGNAGDGNANSYWESQNNAFPQWLQVDLGSSQQICQVSLTWEAAYATAFQIQVSADATTWTTICGRPWRATSAPSSSRS